MSREDCAPGAIITALINCIVDGSRQQQVGCDGCLRSRRTFAGLL